MSALQLIQEKIKYLWEYQKLIVLSVIFTFVLLVIAIIVAFSTAKSSRLNTSSAPVSVTDSSNKNTTFPFPSVFFDSYTDKSSTPSAYLKLIRENNKNINVYSFKNNFSDTEIQDFAKSLGVTVDTLNFNKISGSFHYQSQGQEVKSTALNFLSTLKIGNTTLTDASLTCNITYKRKDLPGVTFTECHRDWDKIGLPVYNYFGILNVPEDIPLSSFELGSVNKDFPANKSIVDVTIKGKKTIAASGKMRPADFNTITVGADSDGRIFSISSNLRWIENTKQYPSSELLTPEDALKQFMDHKSDLSLTIPAGSGTIDWGKVYQDNKAHAKEAVITEYILSYLENPPSVKQSFLAPMYTIRGYTTLDTGFRVNFIQTVPALKDKTSFLTQAEIDKKVLGASTQLAEADNSQTIHIGVYNPPSPTPAPTTQPNNTSSQYPTIPSGNKEPAQPGRYYLYTCPPDISLVSDLDPSVDGRNSILGNSFGNYYYLPSWNMPLDNQGLPPDDFKGCRFTTTASPSVFIYLLQKTSISISTSLTTTYADPSRTGDSWQGTIYPSGIFIPINSNIPSDYLYYEYSSAKVSFNIPSSGFSVKYSDWRKEVENIADRFGLNSKEKDRLVLEVKNELYGKPTSEYLNISIIDPDELNKNLPLSISPNPDNIYRIHLSLAPSDTYQTLPQPTINPISRTNFYVVEVGAKYESK